MKIFCGYETTDAPWGGANTFLRALYKELAEAHGIEIAFSLDRDVDLVFLNQTSRGPGGGSQPIGQDLMDRLLAQDRSVPVVIRAVNLRRHSNQLHGFRWWFSEDRKRDRTSLAMLSKADCVIFQSDYQREVFLKNGCRPRRERVIRNGADQRFATLAQAPFADVATLDIFASSFSAKKQKRHDVLARLSEIEGVRVRFAGKWRDSVSPARVRLLGTLGHADMVDHMRGAHYFAHPAQMDQCPNSMIEALAAGVPVLYGTPPGSGPELGSGFGLALDENDLAGTIARARDRYPEFTARLARDRGYFSIARAAADYAALFGEIAGKAS
jgi:glycosyltransferase involved in cell wall biosynthesis